MGRTSGQFHMPVKPAMRMLKGTHQRWVTLLKSLTNKQFERTFHHPEHNRNYTLREILLYMLALQSSFCPY
jgi:hypothetical protein